LTISRNQFIIEDNEGDTTATPPIEANNISGENSTLYIND